jgi:RecG-like helicase
MTSTPAPHVPAFAAGSLPPSLDATERVLKDCAERTRRGNRLTAIVGVGLLLLLGAYFLYGYQQISSVMEPNTLVSVAEQWLEDKLPEGRRAVEAEVDKSAPTWAASLSKQAQSSLPSIREKLEGYVVEQVDQTLDETVDVTESQFRKFLQENRDSLEQGFKDLATNPKLADESLARLEEALNSHLETDMKLGSKELFASLEQMNAKLQHLKEDRKLTAEEALERQVLMLLRRLQLENVHGEPIAAQSAEKTAALPLPRLGGQSTPAETATKAAE